MPFSPAPFPPATTRSGAGPGTPARGERRRVLDRGVSRAADPAAKPAQTFIDMTGGMRNIASGQLHYDLHGEASHVAFEREESAFRPKVANVAPRPQQWAASRSNTQTPPAEGPGAGVAPTARVPRGPAYFGKFKKLL